MLLADNLQAAQLPEDSSFFCLSMLHFGCPIDFSRIVHHFPFFSLGMWISSYRFVPFSLASHSYLNIISDHPFLQVAFAFPLSSFTSAFL